jgi:DNA-binding transcriptional regulator GbsR (MarR family)
MDDLDRVRSTFVDGMGAAAATSGVLNQLQGRIFGLLYLSPEPLTLDEIAAELQQSKSNISINVQGLLEWHLVRRVKREGSRKDYHEAATDFWRVMQEILERRFRWNLRQVIAAADETERVSGEAGLERKARAFVAERLAPIKMFFGAVDAGIAAFTRGEVFSPDLVRAAKPGAAPSKKR